VRNTGQDKAGLSCVMIISIGILGWAVPHTCMTNLPGR
jgi:hypothetical protein